MSDTPTPNPEKLIFWQPGMKDPKIFYASEKEPKGLFWLIAESPDYAAIGKGRYMSVDYICKYDPALWEALQVFVTARQDWEAWEAKETARLRKQIKMRSQNETGIVEDD